MMSNPHQITSADLFLSFPCPKNTARSSINNLIFYCIKQIDYIFPCVCTLIDHRICHSV